MTTPVYSLILKHNPYHGRDGRFTNRKGAGAAADAMAAAERANRLARAAGRAQAESTVATRSTAAGNFGRAAAEMESSLSSVPQADRGRVLLALSYPAGSTERGAIKTMGLSSDTIRGLTQAAERTGLTTHGMNMRGEQMPVARVPTPRAPAAAVAARTGAAAPAVAAQSTVTPEVRAQVVQSLAAPVAPARTFAEHDAQQAATQAAAARMASATAYDTALANSNTAHSEFKRVMTDANISSTDQTKIIMGYHEQARQARVNGSDPAQGKFGATRIARTLGFADDAGQQALHRNLHAAGTKFAIASHAEGVARARHEENQNADRAAAAVVETQRVAAARQAEATATAARTAHEASLRASAPAVSPAPAARVAGDSVAERHMNRAAESRRLATEAANQLQTHFQGLTPGARSAILNGANAEEGSAARVEGNAFMRSSGLASVPAAAQAYSAVNNHAEAARQSVAMANAANSTGARENSPQAAESVQSVATAPAANAAPVAVRVAGRAAAARAAAHAAEATAVGERAYRDALSARSQDTGIANRDLLAARANTASAALRSTLEGHLAPEQINSVTEAFARSGLPGQQPGQGAAALGRYPGLPDNVRTQAQAAGLSFNGVARDLDSANRTIGLNENHAVRARADAVAAHMASAPETGRRASWMTPGSKQPSGPKLAKIMADPALRVKLHERHIKELATMGIRFDGASGTPAEQARAWDRSVKGTVTPHEVLNAMTGDTTSHMRDRGGSLTISLNSSGFNVSGTGVKIHGTKASMIERQIDISRKEAYHAYLRFATTDTGSGRKFFQASIPLYEKMGLKSVGVSPGLDGGAYAWTRFGFTSTNPQANVRHLGGYVTNGLREVAPNPAVLSKHEKKEFDAYGALIAKYRSLPDAEAKYFPRAITDIQPNHLAMRHAKSLGLNSPVAAKYTQTKLKLNGKDMGYVQTSKLEKMKEKLLSKLPEAERANAQFSTGKVKGFGKALVQEWFSPGGHGNWSSAGGLDHSHGTGALRLDDPRTMEHVRKYAGIRKPRTPRARRTGNGNSTVTSALAAAGPVIAPAGNG
jgi:hypothetical protein